MSHAYLHYDVFTRERFRGNQLAVFTDARGMDGALMQRLAREMNFSESTFILPAERPDTDVRMRIFTPFLEMPMAGHPTVGSTFALAETGVIAPGTARFVFGLNIGPTPVDLEWGADGRLRFVWMTQPLPSFEDPLTEREAVAAALGLSADDLVPDHPVQVVACGVPFLYVPLRDPATVDRAVSDAAALTRLAATLGRSLPIFLFAAPAEAAGVTAYSRMFAPTFGIVEDPATGVASGPLGCYLVRHGIVTGAAAGTMVSLQGAAMGRTSRIHIAIAHADGAITGVRIGGEAVLVGRGDLLA